MQIDQTQLDRILPGVQKPARYTGGEYNSTVKDWDRTDIKIALAFPDIYDLGMSNLGLTILYDIINGQDHALAERVYMPWHDMDAAMRQADLPLFSLETRHTLTDFDLLGIGLPYQQLYTNTLSLLDLAGFPLLSSDRDERFPLVMAGGSSVYNPEPMADFIDFFVAGEGEEVILEIIDACRQLPATDRETQLRRLADIPGIYVPQFYKPTYAQNGHLVETKPLVAEAKPIIVKRIVPVLPPPVTRFIVPFVDVVFNRAAIEIQRGCTRGCRFCQAGMIFRPVRQRPMSQILETVEQISQDTGFQEISLLSLSSTDHTQIEPLVQALLETGKTHDVSVSLPSSRIESVSVRLVDMLTQGRRTGFTFAPEAATDRLRDVINKTIATPELLEVADTVYRRGWRTIKLYFMIGQPSETDEDVQAIAHLAKQVLDVGRQHHGGKAQVRVGVSTFVPQPHTPFQWAGLNSIADIRRKQSLLKKAFAKARGVIFNWNDPQESLLEAALVRGDRRLGTVIKRAWEKGCRFDGWREEFHPDLWWEAFKEEDLDPHWYASRPRPTDEIFPWDHINTGVRKKWLLQDWEAAQRGETNVDCRQSCLACGILTTFAGIRNQTTDEDWMCPSPKPAESGS